MLILHVIFIRNLLYTMHFKFAMQIIINSIQINEHIFFGTSRTIRSTTKLKYGFIKLEFILHKLR